MGYLDRLLAAASRKAEAPAPPGRLRVSGDGGGRWLAPDAGSAERQAALYANLAWIQIAVANVANVVATAPLSVARLAPGREPETQPGHAFELLLRRPNPAMSRYEFLEATCAWRAITGNCYWWLNRLTPTSPPDELWIIPSGQITPLPDGAGGVRGYRYDPGDGAMMMLPVEEVVHFRTFNPLSRYVGLSAVQALAIDGAADLAAQRYNAAFYDRDNAKPGGLLAFADNIDQPTWDRLQEDMRDQTGGTKNRRLMLLRNVGPGGVQWIATQMSRAEMGYLEQRTFTKEEVFALLAPGLASILAVNATEANSTAGKDTFLEMAVAPALTAIAEKITNDVLPAYGDGLTAAFADVSRADTAVELQQQQAAARVMTVNEVRAKFYGLPPLGDARGQQLAAGASAAPPASPAPTDPTPDALAMAGKALDRRRWRDKAIKAQAAGRAADVPFTPDWLSDDEAMTIRAALRRGDLAGAFGGE